MLEYDKNVKESSKFNVFLIFFYNFDIAAGGGGATDYTKGSGWGSVRLNDSFNEARDIAQCRHMYVRRFKEASKPRRNRRILK